MENLGCLGIMIVILVVWAFSFFGAGLLVWGLWKLLMVGGFGLNPLSYWACCGIGFLLSALFGGTRIIIKK